MISCKAVAIFVLELNITSSFFFKFKTFTAKNKALVPLDKTAYFDPCHFAKFFSKFSTILDDQKFD